MSFMTLGPVSVQNCHLNSTGSQASLSGLLKGKLHGQWGFPMIRGGFSKEEVAE